MATINAPASPRDHLHTRPALDPSGQPVSAGLVAELAWRAQARTETTKCTTCHARHDGMCDAMPEADLAELSAIASVIAVPPGKRFVTEGDTAEHFFALIDGTTRLLKTLPDGRQQITSFAGRGDFLGLASGPDYAYSAEAVDNVQFCRFPRARLRTLFGRFPGLEKRLLKITCNELVLAQEQMLLLGRKHARERIASFLVLRATKYPGTASIAGMPIKVPLPMTRVDIADYLGLRLETVCRTLSRLKQDKLIGSAPANGVVILNRTALEDCAACM